MAEPIIKTEYTDGAVKIVYEFDYPDFVVGSLPESCYHCPVGFMDHNCGRRVPLDWKGRPPECKLRTLEEYLRQQLTTNCHQLETVTNRSGLNGWISVEDGLPEPDVSVLVIANGEPHKNITLDGAYELAEYGTDGWILEMWPEWMDAKVSHWMPLPEPPEVEG